MIVRKEWLVGTILEFVDQLHAMEIELVAHRALVKTLVQAQILPSAQEALDEARKHIPDHVHKTYRDARESMRLILEKENLEQEMTQLLSTWKPSGAVQ